MSDETIDETGAVATEPPVADDEPTGTEPTGPDANEQTDAPTGDSTPDGAPNGHGDDITDVAAVAYEELAGSSAEGPARDVGLLAGIEVEVSVELGRAKLPLRSLLTMAPGAVVDLDRAAGSSVEILVNGTVVARGEVVVVDGVFGVRVTEILRR